MYAAGLYGPRGAGVAEHLDYEAQKLAGENPAPIKGPVMDSCWILITAHAVSFRSGILPA